MNFNEFFSTITLFSIIIAIISAVALFVMSISSPFEYRNIEKMSSKYKSYPYFVLAFFFSMMITSSSIGFHNFSLNKDFKQTILENPIVSIKINEIFYDDKSVLSEFNKLTQQEYKSHYTKYDCIEFSGSFFLENGQEMQFKMFRQCKNERVYSIISNEYKDKDVFYGTVETKKFDNVIGDSTKFKKMFTK